MSIIDVHAHAFPDKLASRAIAQLESECPWKAVGDGTVAGLLASMDAADIDIACICTIATKPDQVDSIFEWCKQIRNDRIEPMPSVHPDTPKAGKWVRKIAKAKFAGIKLHPMYQAFAADEPRLDPIYAAAAEAGLLVEVHCGRDIAFPPDDDRAAPARFRRVIERHPELKLLCTHMGGWRMWDEVERELLGADVFFETSFSLGDRGADGERIANMIRRHGVERVMFGTDWPWAGHAEQLEQIKALLRKSEMRQVLSTNAARILGY